MTGRTDNNRDAAIWGGVAIFGFVVFAAIKLAPQAFGLLIGGLAVGVLVMVGVIKMDDPRCPGWAVRLIATGTLTCVTYFALAGATGADVDMKRFRRAWEANGADVSILIHHPWAVVPLTCAAALIGAGAAIGLQALKEGRSR